MTAASLYRPDSEAIRHFLHGKQIDLSLEEAGAIARDWEVVESFRTAMTEAEQEETL